MNQSQVFILSGPSAVGKTTVWETYKSARPDTLIEKVVTTTSRAMRPGEIDGVHYHFWDTANFTRAIHAKNELIEYAAVHGNYYGSTFAELERIVALGKKPLYIIDPQGMVHLKPVLEDAGYAVTSVFLEPPSMEELKERLIGRGVNSPEDLATRYANAIVEMEERHFYDISIVNHTIEATLERLHELFSAERV